MRYSISTENFYNSKMFDSNGKFSHKSGYRFKLFPFVTNQSSNPVLELKSLAGTYLSLIEGKKAIEVTAAELSASIKSESEIQAGQETLFEEMIRQLFFNSDGTIKPLNLELLEQVISNEASEKRTAEYLVDVLGDKSILSSSIVKAKEKAKANYNVLERCVISKLKSDSFARDEKSLSYWRVTNSLTKAFEEDFAYIIENPKRAREYLISLLELYYFTYTAQTSLQLSRFLDGEREVTVPLFFSLEWEKTSQSRLCFSEGWQKLKSAIDKIFAHAIVLELLNQTDEGSEIVDYIRISKVVENDDRSDAEMSSQIDVITNCYRKVINDCPDMNELTKDELPQGKTASSIRFLFESVKTQFENTGREKAYKSYASKFEQYCHKFLKNRGRSGLMLNLSEETLIFITKLCIKDREQLRLKDVFMSFEQRGIFLDEVSKEQIALYYEKLNLIEKKSDSGDAKYVKRIL